MDELQFITESYVAQTGVRRFKAPSGKLYKIHAIGVTNFGASTTQLMIVDRYVEEEHNTIPIGSNPFFAWDGGLDGHYASITLPKPIIAKYISMGSASTANLVLIVTVYYTLEKATLTDLVYEFVSRGKNP